VRRFKYVGPAEIRAAAIGAAPGRPIRSPADLSAWSSAEPEPDQPVTYVVSLDGVLLLAPRRSEHVACAGGSAVLAAGEIRFAGTTVVEVSNQSTGYCPDLDSWDAVADALDQAGLDGPDGYTHEVVFRQCPSCFSRNIVRDGDFTCALCAGPLPAAWNFD
jgi:hypothetical protein